VKASASILLKAFRPCGRTRPFSRSGLAFGNLETPARRHGPARRAIPINAPVSLPASLGQRFTVLSANNHAFDQGRVRRPWIGCAERLVAMGGEDRAQAEALQIVERQGIKVAFLGFTDLFNMDLNRRATEPWVRPLDLEPALAAVRRPGLALIWWW
jgi:poly-gamma-glutamate synthesis protein (capsule biosynthesis protein)